MNTLTKALQLYTGTNIPEQESFPAVLNTLFNLFDKSQLGSKSTNLAKVTQYKDNFPGFQDLMNLGASERDAVINHISELYVHNTNMMDDTNFRGFCINSRYMTHSFSADDLTHIFSQDPKDARNTIAEIAGIEFSPEIETMLRALEREDLILILDMLDDEFPQAEASNQEYIEKFMWITRAKKFSRSLERVFQPVIIDSENQALIRDIQSSLRRLLAKDRKFSRFNSSGRRCNCLYHSVAIGLINHLCDKETSEGEIERILCAPNGFLQAFNTHRNLNLSAAEFIAWMKSTGQNGKPNVNFIQFALAPTLRKMVHERNNMMGSNRAIITSPENHISDNNSIFGMENHYAAAYLSNILGVEIIVYNDYHNIEAINRSYPMALLTGVISDEPFSSLLDKGAISTPRSHFHRDLPKIYLSGNLIHFQVLSTNKFESLDLDNRAYSQLDSVYSNTRNPSAYFEMIEPRLQPRASESTVNPEDEFKHKLSQWQKSVNTNVTASATQNTVVGDYFIKDAKNGDIITGVNPIYIKEFKALDHTYNHSKSLSHLETHAKSPKAPTHHKISDEFKHELLQWQQSINTNVTASAAQNTALDHYLIKDANNKGIITGVNPKYIKEFKALDHKKAEEVRAEKKMNKLLIAQLEEIGFSTREANQLCANGLQLSNETLTAISNIAPKVFYLKILLDFILSLTIIYLPITLSNILEKNHYTSADRKTAKELVLKQHHAAKTANDSIDGASTAELAY
jgi:hypothetical protein